MHQEATGDSGENNFNGTCRMEIRVEGVESLMGIEEMDIRIKVMLFNKFWGRNKGRRYNGSLTER